MKKTEQSEVEQERPVDSLDSQPDSTTRSGENGQQQTLADSFDSASGAKTALIFYMFAALTDPLPDLIAQADRELLDLRPEHIDWLKSVTTEALRESGVLDSGLRHIQQWAMSRDNSTVEKQAATGIATLAGAILSGFQLGLITAEYIRESAGARTPGGVQ